MKRFGHALLTLALAAVIPHAAGAQQAPGEVRVFSEQRPEGGWDVYAANGHFLPHWLEVSTTGTVGVRPSRELPVALVIAPGTEREYLFSMLPTGSSRMSFRTSYLSAPGDPGRSRHDDSVLYLFPFGHGGKHRITQGYNGAHTHRGENAYALDFDMPEGTPVHAARGGIVADVKDSSSSGGYSGSYARYGNFVLMYHDDGSFGTYGHLRRGGAAVKPEQRVEAGQLIGYSGSTGISSGPHLHFDVRLLTPQGTVRTVPVRFLGSGGQAIDPEQSRFYYSYHPGGPSFEERYGSDLRDEDFADYRKEIPPGRQPEIRVEEVDVTYLLFVRNPTEREAEVTLKITPRGMSMSGTSPLTLRVPARTEIYALLMRPDENAERWGYSYSHSYRAAE